MTLPLLSPHVTSYHTLRIHHLNADILIPSYFSASGLGIRKLPSQKLLISYAFPSVYHYLQLVSQDFTPIIPLQILDALLHPAVLARQSSVTQILSRHKQFTLAPLAVPTAVTYLPAINKFLTNDWRSEKEHVQQVAKEYNAPIDYSLWNMRISTVFPRITPCWCDWLRERPAVYSKILEKVVKFLQRGYLHITPESQIKSFIDYFVIKKGESEIRVVFNGTSCGFNETIWAPQLRSSGHRPRGNVY